VLLMDPFDAAETVKQAWLERATRSGSVAVRLLACPYCGKADRVRELSLEELGGAADPALAQAWESLAQTGRPALCGFCLNLVLLAGDKVLMPGAE
jgi:hypothetical protein